MYSCEPLMNALTMFCQPAAARALAVPTFGGVGLAKTKATAMAGVQFSSHSCQIAVVEWNEEALRASCCTPLR